MSAPVCPLCKSAPITTIIGIFHWQTSCKCVVGRSRITAGHSARRWILNCRKRYERHAVAIIAARSGQP
jgi:hypothetical protein